MKTEQIKMMIEAIIRDGSGIVYTDVGSGCGGSGFLYGETLQDMLEFGNFDDAIAVDMDASLAVDSFAGQCEFDRTTDWTQIEYSYGDNGYNQIAWIWAA